VIVMVVCSMFFVVGVSTVLLVDGLVLVTSLSVSTNLHSFTHLCLTTVSFEGTTLSIYV